MVSSSWWGIAVPVKTSADIQAKLRAWNDNIIANPDYVARLAEMAIEPLIMTPEPLHTLTQQPRPVHAFYVLYCEGVLALREFS